MTIDLTPDMPYAPTYTIVAGDLDEAIEAVFAMHEEVEEIWKTILHEYEPWFEFTE